MLFPDLTHTTTEFDNDYPRKLKPPFNAMDRRQQRIPLWLITQLNQAASRYIINS